MTHKILYFICLFVTIKANAQISVTTNISKPYCLLNFLEVSTGKPRVSTSLYEFTKKNTKSDTVFEQICNEYNEIEIHTSIPFEGYAKIRQTDFNIFNSLVYAAVNSSTIKEFQKNATGILSNHELQKLVSIMNKVEPYYNNLIWNKSESQLKLQLKNIKKYEKRIATAFNEINYFYNSTWPNELPFTISIFPILGEKSGMIATPHINTLCIGVLTDTAQYELKTSIALHEMCHLLYKEQSKEIQNQFENYFLQHKSEYAKHAYNLFDEGLATAIGNGLEYKKNIWKFTS